MRGRCGLTKLFLLPPTCFKPNLNPHPLSAAMTSLFSVVGFEIGSWFSLALIIVLTAFFFMAAAERIKSQGEAFV